MYILAKQRDTIARTLEPTKERDSRNVSGPLTDRRPSCRDLTPKSYLRLTTCGRTTKATRNYYWLLPLRSPGPGAAIFATFAFSPSQPCRSVLNLKNFSTPTYRKKCILVTSERPHLRSRSPGGRTVDEVKKCYGAFSKASTRRKKKRYVGPKSVQGEKSYKPAKFESGFALFSRNTPQTRFCCIEVRKFEKNMMLSDLAQICYRHSLVTKTDAYQSTGLYL